MRNPIAFSVLLSVVLAVAMIGVLAHVACGCKKGPPKPPGDPASMKEKEFKKMPAKASKTEDGAAVAVIEVE